MQKICAFVLEEFCCCTNSLRCMAYGILLHKVNKQKYLSKVGIVPGSCTDRGLNPQIIAAGSWLACTALVTEAGSAICLINRKHRQY